MPIWLITVDSASAWSHLGPRASDLCFSSRQRREGTGCAGCWLPMRGDMAGLFFPRPRGRPRLSTQCPCSRYILFCPPQIPTIIVACTLPMPDLPSITLFSPRRLGPHDSHVDNTCASQCLSQFDSADINTCQGHLDPARLSQRMRRICGDED